MSGGGIPVHTSFWHGKTIFGLFFFTENKFLAKSAWILSKMGSLGYNDN